MGYKAVDLLGRVFGRLRVVSRPPYTGGQRMWGCLCECGATITLSSATLNKARGTKSCGCLKTDLLTARNTKHDKSATPEYAVWCGMKQRCAYRGHASHHRYGGRGISVCKEWLVFENFLRDMGPRPSDLHSIEREDNDGDYCKDNCSWQTRVVQAGNTTNTRHLTLGNKTMPAKAWAKELGVNYSGLISRLNRGWSHERALSESFRKMT